MNYLYYICKMNNRLLILILIFLSVKFTPNKVKNYLAYMYHFNTIDNLKDYNYDIRLNSAIKSVKNKVIISNNISNKDYVLEKLDNVIVKSYYNNINLKFINNKFIMLYVKNTYKDIDYIVVNENKSFNRYYDFVHELNHLVEQNKIKINDIIYEDIVNYNMTIRNYNIYFRKWRRSEKNVSIGQLYTSTVYSNKKYYLSDSEIYARVSSFKNFLQKHEFINECDIINYGNIDELVKFFNSDTLVNTSYSKYILFDFISIIPFINWENENISLI
jgi:hypothetical protein